MLALEVVALPVTDVDRALAFYTEQTGFTVDYHPQHRVPARAAHPARGRQVRCNWSPPA
jgi:catechol 2,3-dioxygenase-like lactoylglutathione lyase family enzyme